MFLGGDEFSDEALGQLECLTFLLGRLCGGTLRSLLFHGTSTPSWVGLPESQRVPDGNILELHQQRAAGVHLDTELALEWDRRVGLGEINCRLAIDP